MKGELFRVRDGNQREEKAKTKITCHYRIKMTAIMRRKSENVRGSDDGGDEGKV